MRRWLLYICVLSCVWKALYAKSHKSTKSTMITNQYDQDTTKWTVDENTSTSTPKEEPRVEPSKALKARTAPEIPIKGNETCIKCVGEKRQIVSVDEDFNKLQVDPDLKPYVSPILERLKSFKQPTHPRVRIWHELLKVGMGEYAKRTADSLYVPDKYNVQADRDKSKD